MVILEINNLRVNYGSFTALNGFHMKVQKGEVCAFVGSNGAGKTTTFSTIAGFLRAKSGHIKIMEQSLKDFRKNGGLIGLLPQDVSFFDERTVISQLIFLARLSGISKNNARKEAEWTLEMTGLQEKMFTYPSQLSRGLKVRLGIAQAILGKPPLILLDEPTAGLDPLRRNQFYELINRLKKETTFIIFMIGKRIF